MCVLFALWFALRGFQKGNDTPAPVRSAQEELGLLGNTQSPSSATASAGLRTSLHSSGGFSQLEGGRNEQLPLQRAARSQKAQEQSESPVQMGPSTLTLWAAALRMAPGPPQGLQCPQHGALWPWDGAQPAATHLPGWSGYLCLQYASSDAYTFSRSASTSAGLERPFESERQGKEHQPGASRCAGR